jgi:hypothetical protein
MSIGKRLLAMLAGGSAVGAGVAAAAVNSPDATAPDPVEVGGSGGTTLDIEGDAVRVDAQASPVPDLLDSAENGSTATTTGTGDSGGATDSPNDTTANTRSADTGTGDSPDTPDDADSPDNSGPGSDSSGPGSDGDENHEDNSGSGSSGDDGGDDNSGPGS